MPDDHKRRLVRLLNRRGIPIIEDDIYCEVYFDGTARPSLLKTYDRKGLVLTCSSFSKTLAPGLRVGWVIAGEPFRERILRLKAGTNVCTSTLDQYVLARFLTEAPWERHLRRLRAALRQQVIKTALAIQAAFPEETRLAVPSGGSLLWVQLDGAADGDVIYRSALENRIAILPGSVCSAAGIHRNYIRIGCGYPVTERVEQGIRTLGRIVAASIREGAESPQ
jgi:DNA-binding transcriptional MocR family regulator